MMEPWWNYDEQEDGWLRNPYFWAPITINDGMSKGRHFMVQADLSARVFDENGNLVHEITLPEDAVYDCTIFEMQLEIARQAKLHARKGYTIELRLRYDKKSP